MTNINYRAEKLHHKIHRHAKHHVHRLREKPEHHRKAVAFGIAATVTLFVFVLWYFLSLPKILEAYRVDKSEVQRIDSNPVAKLKEAFTAGGGNGEADSEAIGVDPNVGVTQTTEADMDNPYQYNPDTIQIPE